MTVKEINDLRKSGRLAEALEAAEIEFSKSADRYTAGALFWCLYELYKSQPRDEALATLARMKAINDDFPDDTYMQKTLANIERSLIPHFQEVKDAVDKSKAGDRSVEHYQSIALFFDDGELDPCLYADFGWLTYYALRATSAGEVLQRKYMLARYLKLGLQGKSLLHSLILKEAIRVEQDTPLQFRIRDFIRLWGLENLRDEDWEQYKNKDGMLLPSTVEKLIGVYVRELKTDRVEAPAEFVELVDVAVAKYHKSQNMLYFKAIVLVSQGRREEAIDCFRSLILRFPSKAYLWQDAAELVDDKDTQLGLLSKALTLGGDEQFLGGIRLAMAALLIDRGDSAHAKYELDKYRDLYLSRGWHLKEQYRSLEGQVCDVTSAADNRDLYARFSHHADVFIYSGLQEQIAVKISEKMTDDRNRPGRKIATWTLRTDSDETLYLKKPSKYGLDKRACSRYFFSVKVHEGRIVAIQPTDSAPTVDWLKKTEGEIHLRSDRNGHSYAIVDGVYIADHLLRGISDGQAVRVLALRKKDGRWAAIAIFKLSVKKSVE